MMKWIILAFIASSCCIERQVSEDSIDLGKAKEEFEKNPPKTITTESISSTSKSTTASKLIELSKEVESSKNGKRP